ncbi:hypothetical protein Van01_38130 [Micromonospora andamanensis]|uniref:Uncharacterized protein n=1 Tax=Micromonospora andamanensis TaxID=1287068 RepID=A0ABQ4HYA2_9ACTN|nr:hypothetical protein Van01_38130 [Micromonospora andamanensis]
MTNPWPGTTCGVAADSPDSSSLPKPITTSVETKNSGPSDPKKIIAAIGSTTPARTRLVTTVPVRRLHRSSNTPANGPTSEYGSTSTAAANAIAVGVACRSGLNNTLPAGRPMVDDPVSAAAHTTISAGGGEPALDTGAHQCRNPPLCRPSDGSSRGQGALMVGSWRLSADGPVPAGRPASVKR